MQGRRHRQALPLFPSSAELKRSVHVEIMGMGREIRIPLWGHQVLSIPFPATHPWVTLHSLPRSQFLAGKQHRREDGEASCQNNRWAEQEREQRH